MYYHFLLRLIRRHPSIEEKKEKPMRILSSTEEKTLIFERDNILTINHIRI